MPFSGLEWSRKIDENFIVDGIENFELINEKNVENNDNNDNIKISNEINKKFKENFDFN